MVRWQAFLRGKKERVFARRSGGAGPGLCHQEPPWATPARARSCLSIGALCSLLFVRKGWVSSVIEDVKGPVLGAVFRSAGINLGGLRPCTRSPAAEVIYWEPRSRRSRFGRDAGEGGADVPTAVFSEPRVSESQGRRCHTCLSWPAQPSARLQPGPAT